MDWIKGLFYTKKDVHQFLKENPHIKAKIEIQDKKNKEDAEKLLQTVSNELLKEKIAKLNESEWDANMNKRLKNLSAKKGGKVKGRKSIVGKKKLRRTLKTRK
jgi:hypothetical protein